MLWEFRIFHPCPSSPDRLREFRYGPLLDRLLLQLLKVQILGPLYGSMVVVWSRFPRITFVPFQLLVWLFSRLFVNSRIRGLAVLAWRRDASGLGQLGEEVSRPATGGAEVVAAGDVFLGDVAEDDTEAEREDINHGAARNGRPLLSSTPRAPSDRDRPGGMGEGELSDELYHNRAGEDAEGQN